MNEPTTPELLIIEPPEEPCGEQTKGFLPGKGAPVKKKVFRVAAGYLLYFGADVEFHEGDTFPSTPPKDLTQYKAILVANYDLARLKPYFTDFEGVAEWEMKDPGQQATFRHKSGRPVLLAWGLWETALYGGMWVPGNIFYNLEPFIVAADLQLETAALKQRMQSRADEELHRLMGGRVISQDRADWTDVGSYCARGAFGAWEVTKEQRYLDYVKWLFDTAIEKIYFQDGKVCLKVDRPGSPIAGGFLYSLPYLIDLYKVCPEKKYLETLQAGLPMVLSGERLRVTTNFGPFPKGVHADVAVAAFFGELEKIEKPLLDFCLAGEKALRDPKSGAWKYFVINGRSVDCIPGHGCALSISHLTTILEHYPKNLAGYEVFARMFRDLAKGIAHFQDDEGAWHQALDLPASERNQGYTGSIGYAFLKGHRLGLLGKEYRERGVAAWRFLKTRIFTGGTIGVPGGTTHFYNRYYYTHRLINFDYGWWRPVSELPVASEILRLRGAP